MKNQPIHSGLIEIKTLKGNTFCLLKEIVSIRACNKHSCIKFRNKSEILSISNLGWFEEVLPKPVFFRCHRRYLINCEYFEYVNYSSFIISLNGYGSIPFSRYKKKELLDNILSYKHLRSF
jgi:DNA-binding LytR/AlgR family response regulator